MLLLKSINNETEHFSSKSKYVCQEGSEASTKASIRTYRSITLSSQALMQGKVIKRYVFDT